MTDTAADREVQELADAIRSAWPDGDEPTTIAAPEYVCDGWDWRSGKPRHCALRLGHRGSCSGDPCEHPIYMDGRCYDCGEPHPADCDCGMRPPVPIESLPIDATRREKP